MILWPAIYVDRILTREEITHTFETLLGVPRAEIFILTTMQIYEYPVPGMIPYTLLFQPFVHPGTPFPFRLDGNCEEHILGPYQQRERFSLLVGRFCEELHCQAMTDDPAGMDDDMLLIESTTQITPIIIDLTLYEESDEEYEMP